MIVRRNVRWIMLACLVLLGSASLYAQRGGGGGMGGPGGPGGTGGMMGGPHGREMGGNISRTTEPRLRSEPQLSLPGRWWDDRKTIKSLKLRSDQQQKMDDIFNANKGALIALYEDLQREEQRFVSMPPKDLQDESKVFAEIDRVTQARADLEKANFHLLLQLRKEMDPEQVAALDREIASTP